MKIGIIASIWIKNPPLGNGFGAQEYLTYEIAEGLKKKGHDVTLFASGDSKTSANLVSVSEKQVIDLHPADNKIKDIFELINISQAYKMAGQFDIIHNHLLPYSLVFTDLFNTPTVHTLHHQIYRPSHFYIYKRYKGQNFISISEAQRKVLPELNYISTVYNGIDPQFYAFKSKPDSDYLLYIGRLKRYKGIHSAIKVAKKLGLKLKIATLFPNPNQPDFEEVNEYWENDIKPNIGENIEHIGVLQGQEKVSLLQNAKALIFPVERDEPFGMTLIEAMACGTPVIAYNRGAMPEIVVDGETGLMVNLETNGAFEELSCATEKVYNLPEAEYLQIRKNCRLRVENNFTVEKMVDKYEEIYFRYRM